MFSERSEDEERSDDELISNAVNYLNSFMRVEFMAQQTFWKDKHLNTIKKRPNLFALRSWNFIKKYNPKTILDIGCGRSRDPIFFAKKGIQVTATDISGNRIKAIKDFAVNSKLENIQFVVKDTKNLKIKKEYYDVVYSHLSLPYFDQKSTKTIVNKIYNGLKHNGFLFIKCKSIADPDFGKGKKIDVRTFDKNGHIKSFFDIDYMKELLNRFKIIRIRRSSAKYEGHKLKSRYVEAVARR